MSACLWSFSFSFSSLFFSCLSGVRIPFVFIYGSTQSLSRDVFNVLTIPWRRPSRVRYQGPLYYCCLYYCVIDQNDESVFITFPSTSVYCAASESTPPPSLPNINEITRDLFYSLDSYWPHAIEITTNQWLRFRSRVCSSTRRYPVSRCYYSPLGHLMMYGGEQQPFFFLNVSVTCVCVCVHGGLSHGV